MDDRVRDFRVWTYPFLFVCLILISLGTVHAQTPSEINVIRNASDIPALERKSLEFSERFASGHQAALLRAQDSGWITSALLPDGTFLELQLLDEHGYPLYYKTENINAAYTVSANKVWPSGILGLSLTGSGMTLREWDGGAVLSTHQELAGRVTQGDGATSLNDHSTHVAGTMIATGVTANAKGMSYQASLRSFDWSADLSEMSAEAAAGALLSNHSYGYICGWYYNGATWSWYGDPTVSNVQDYKFGFYSSNCRDVDDIAYLSPYYLVCKSAGNDRGDYNGSGPQEMDGGSDGFDCISDMGNAKNILTVGAVNDIPSGYSNPTQVVMSTFSGWGPSDDGRIKPDIVANGISLYSSFKTNNTAYGTMSGTSMATPNACGALMLLQQHHNTLYGAFMKSATLKALAIHTADESGVNPGPDYSFGWGLLNIATAAQVITQKDQLSLIKEIALANGGTYSVSVNSTGAVPLKVTLCWTDRKGTPLSPTLNPPNPMLVHDLDLRVDGTVQPWTLDPANPSAAATTGDNTRDNVEQILIATPSAGSHTITVSHKGTLIGGSQNFSLIVTGIYTSVANPIPFTAQAVSESQIDLNWTKNAANNNVLLAWSPTGTFGTPVNGTAYVAGNTLPGGGTVIYAGGNSAFAHTGLTSNTTYYYKIWSVNGSNQYSYGETANASTLCMLYNSFPVSETFNASTSFPTCWTQQPSGTSNDWSISTINQAGGTGNELMCTWKNVNPGTTRMKTFFFNTIGATSLILSFNHMFDGYTTGCTAKIQTSADGVTWTDESWSISPGAGNIGPELVTTTLTHNLNSPMTMVAFVVTGNLYNYDYWHIDNVTIKAPGYWIGGAAGNLNDWNTAANWGDGLVPNSATNVVITPRNNLPAVNNDPASPANCNDLTVHGSATVTVNAGKKLIVNGTVTLKN